MNGLTGRSVVICGGATGIGAATASRLAAEGAAAPRSRCNGVQPGMVMSETALATMSEEFTAAGLASTRSVRLGRPADLAGTVAFLLSDDAEWINGQVWTVNGGATLHE